MNFTANMESLLDGVEEGKVKWKTIVENFYPDMMQAVEKAEKELEEVKLKTRFPKKSARNVDEIW